MHYSNITRALRQHTVFSTHCLCLFYFLTNKKQFITLNLPVRHYIPDNSPAFTRNRENPTKHEPPQPSICRIQAERADDDSRQLIVTTTKQATL